MNHAFLASGGSVATPIDTFEHHQTESVVEVVSTIHVGRSSYYWQLGEHLKERMEGGYVLLLEGITEPDPEELSRLGPLDRLKLKLLGAQADRTAELFDVILDHSDYMTQAGLMAYLDSEVPDFDDKSKNVDMSIVEHASKSSIINLLRARHSQIRGHKKAGISRDQPTDQNNVAVYNEIARQLNGSVEESATKQKGSNKVVITERNDRVLSKIDEAISEDAAVKLSVVWGVGHLAGLASGIEARGYRNTHRRFVTAAFNSDHGIMGA